MSARLEITRPSVVRDLKRRKRKDFTVYTSSSRLSAQLVDVAAFLEPISECTRF